MGDVLYSPRMIGCLCGRGDTVISIAGFAFAKAGRWCFRKALLVGRRQSVSQASFLPANSLSRHGGWGGSLHPATATRPVAVVELETFALEHERADSVLRFRDEA